VEAIAKDVAYSYEYAKGLKFQDVPDIIVQSIAQDERLSSAYALNVQNVPAIIVQRIAIDVY